MTKKHYHDTDLSTFDKVTFRFHVQIISHFINCHQPVASDNHAITPLDIVDNIIRIEVS